MLHPGHHPPPAVSRHRQKYPLDQPPVSNTIQRYTTSETAIVLTCSRRDTLCQLQDNFLGDELDRRCQVHIFLPEFGLRLSWRTIKKSAEFLVGHRRSSAVVEVLQVELKRPLRFYIILGVGCRYFRNHRKIPHVAVNGSL